jgi:hypothetical protein
MARFGHLLLCAPAASLVIPPPVQLIAPVGIALGGWMARLNHIEKQQEEFATAVNWAEPADSDGDACVIIGEEVAAAGRQWLVCDEKPQDPGMDCTLDESLGTGEWLCKAPKAQ